MFYELKDNRKKNKISRDDFLLLELLKQTEFMMILLGDWCKDVYIPKGLI